MSAQAFFSSFALDQMNSTIAGWSTFRITLLAARRVLPPDLITPANASKPFMKETGPLAFPPVERCSRDERNGERFVPVPDPYLKSIPSVIASCMMDLMSSFMEFIKQAEH